MRAHFSKAGFAGRRPWLSPLMALSHIPCQERINDKSQGARGDQVGRSTVPREYVSTSALRRRRWVSGTFPTCTPVIREY